jgi:hypothetical protein
VGKERYEEVMLALSISDRNSNSAEDGRRTWLAARRERKPPPPPNPPRKKKNEKVNLPETASERVLCRAQTRTASRKGQRVAMRRADRQMHRDA